MPEINKSASKCVFDLIQQSFGPIAFKIIRGPKKAVQAIGLVHLLFLPGPLT
jgi:hypothetical protein